MGRSTEPSLVTSAEYRICKEQGRIFFPGGTVPRHVLSGSQLAVRLIEVWDGKTRLSNWLVGWFFSAGRPPRGRFCPRLAREKAIK